MRNVIELEAWESTHDLCPVCAVEVTLASSAEATEVACDCAGYLVA